MPELVRDGLRLRYTVTGAGSTGVLLAHGMTGTGAADWSRLLPHLTGRFRCVVPDLRGHGSSDFREEGFGYQAMREDLRALIAAEGLDRPHLVGFSMGAELLLDLELTYPGTASSLVLIGVSTGVPPDRGGFAAVSEVPRWPRALRELHEDKHGADHWRTLFRLVAGTWDERPELPDTELARLSCPVLLVQGTDELEFKRRQTERLAAVAADARLVELSGADHPVHVQQAERVNTLVREFLVEVEQRLDSAGERRFLRHP